MVLCGLLFTGRSIVMMVEVVYPCLTISVLSRVNSLSELCWAVGIHLHTLSVKKSNDHLSFKARRLQDVCYRKIPHSLNRSSTKLSAMGQSQQYSNGQQRGQRANTKVTSGHLPSTWPPFHDLPFHSLPSPPKAGEEWGRRDGYLQGRLAIHNQSLHSYLVLASV